MSDTLKLWFFRDLTDEQRLKLFALFGLPTDEIGKVHGRQAIALRHIIQKLRDLLRDEIHSPAPTRQMVGTDIMGRAGRLAARVLSGWTVRDGVDPQKIADITTRQIAEALEAERHLAHANQTMAPIGYVYEIDGPLPVFDKNPPSEERWLVHADAPVAVYAAPQQQMAGLTISAAEARALLHGMPDYDFSAALTRLANWLAEYDETPTPPGNQIRTAECDGKDAVPATGQLPVGTASTAEQVVGTDQKEIILLHIIADMGGSTDSNDYPCSWLNWFCNDDAEGGGTDTFNRCEAKGWINTTHDSDSDHSTTTLTAAGRVALATATEDNGE